MTRLPFCLALLATLFVAGCFGSAATVPVNLDFSRTNFGYINSGGYRAGSFFEWDRVDGQLIYLGEVPGFDVPDNPRNQTIRAQYRSGIEIGGEFEQVAGVAADAAIRRRSAFEIENGNRFAYNNVYGKVTGFLNKDKIEGGTIIDEWGLIDAIGDEERLFVIIRDVTYGDNIKLLVEGEVQAGGGISVPLQGDKSLEVKLEGQGLEGINGDNVAVSFFVYVLEPYWLKKNGAQNLAVRRVRGVDVAPLPRLLRRVGTAS